MTSAVGERMRSRTLGYTRPAEDWIAGDSINTIEIALPEINGVEMENRSQVIIVPFKQHAISACARASRQRSQVWDNVRRNDLIARTAEGFVTNPKKALIKCGVTVDEVRLPANRVRPRVVILAETSFHAGRMGRLLPRWEVRDAVPVMTDYPWWDVDIDYDEVQPPGRISTLMHAVRYGIACDVLVRATAGTGKLDWYSIRGGCRSVGTKPALVIDFSDELNNRVRENAIVRLREYREQGLELLGVKKGRHEENTMSSIPSPAGPTTRWKHAAAVGEDGSNDPSTQRWT